MNTNFVKHPATPIITTRACLLTVMVLMLSGCQYAKCVKNTYQTPPPPTPIGTHIDDAERTMEDNAELSDFVMYQHEFIMNNPGMNIEGQDHLKQIAMRLNHGDDLPVIVEQCTTAIDPNSEYEYPVNRDPVLDGQRRELVVQSLLAMGVPDADQRVVVSGAYAEGMEASEARSIYHQGFNSSARSMNSWGNNSWGGFGGGSWGPYSGW